MKKVVIIGPSPTKTKGGMATVILNQLSSQPEQFGYEYEFLTSHEEGSSLTKSKVAIQSLVKLWEMDNLSLAHIHVASGASFYRKSLLSCICRLKRIPFILHIHACDFDTFYASANPLAKFWIKATLESANKIFVLSNSWKLYLKSIGLTQNVEILHNGVDTNEFSSSPSFAKTIHNFLFIGRLGQRKGTYDLITAIQHLKEQGKLDLLNFYFIGDGEIEKVKQKVNQANLKNHVHLLGWKEGKSKIHYLRNCSTIILPSYNEGLPMALIEAMACGNVVISTTVGGIPDLVEQNKNGYLITPGNIEALVNSISKVIQDQDAAHQIHLNNIKKINENYNLSLLNKKMFGTYRSIIDSNSSSVILNTSNSPF
ncbi:glycosyltransferase [Litoribacter alkaliphilus]|uniref:Glycosyltransferase n=1 Tax=Litoribacter ruber TaxID=702568 RepID=A0AAP2CJT7_9BACT|nr:glycosyltransferase [Litoribacter alkaliphilus]MBS9524516.1 glycosyltransferase [Litoribacter alkaliphilus]